jgi:hypothetical protein
MVVEYISGYESPNCLCSTVTYFDVPCSSSSSSKSSESSSSKSSESSSSKSSESSSSESSSESSSFHLSSNTSVSEIVYNLGYIDLNICAKIIELSLSESKFVES